MAKIFSALLVVLLALVASPTLAEECSQSSCPPGTKCDESPMICHSAALVCPPYSCVPIGSSENPCAVTLCAANTICLPEPKQCVTTPCPQARCLSPEEYVCATANCPSGSRCVIERKECFTSPCPQFKCEADPCAGAVCPQNSVCLAEPKECFTTPCPQYACMPKAQCPEMCPENYAPVCASDGHTYGNECKLRAMMCSLKTSIYIQHSGACEADGPLPNCPTNCPANYAPVCGSDGVTYSNACNLQVSSCLTKHSIAVAHQGECSDCVIACTQEYAPVCGTDGHTYSNECGLRVAACNAKTEITVASKGECPATNNCPEFCPMNYEPVCGSDGNTYNNPCFLEVNACLSKATITVAHQGSCDDGCDTMCTEEYAPVCGTNRQTYSNKCFLEAAICQEKHAFALMHKGACVGSSWKDFAPFDADHSDSISPAEFAAASGLSAEQAALIFPGYDTNGDQQITSSDFAVNGNSAAPELAGLGVVAISMISLAAFVVGMAIVVGAATYMRSKKHARGFEALAASRNTGLYDEEIEEL